MSPLTLRLSLSDVHAWKNEILNNTNIQLIEPSAIEMINSTQLHDYHKDPFDRLLVSQALQNNFLILTKDREIQRYQVETLAHEASCVRLKDQHQNLSVILGS